MHLAVKEIVVCDRFAAGSLLVRIGGECWCGTVDEGGGGDTEEPTEEVAGSQSGECCDQSAKGGSDWGSGHADEAE